MACIWLNVAAPGKFPTETEETRSRCVDIQPPQGRTIVFTLKDGTEVRVIIEPEDRRSP